MTGVDRNHRGRPRGVGVIERLSVNLDLYGGGLEIHLIDPFPPRAGRVWRNEQSPLCRLVISVRWPFVGAVHTGPTAIVGVARASG